MMQQEVSDRLEIMQLAAEFADAVNSRDFDRFATLWTEDSHWTIGEPLSLAVHGRDNVVSKVRELAEKQTGFYQAVHQGTMDIQGDRAFCRWGITEYIKFKTPGEGEVNHSVYTDELRRTNERWRFVRRDYQYVYVEKMPLDGTWYPLH